MRAVKPKTEFVNLKPDGKGGFTVDFKVTFPTPKKFLEGNTRSV